ncbi:MmcQ/YjbR family DNA-binding protein [Phenylobacterium hankyongense]|uniref:MmcQ/YjbR family DNA-binding protein n=1 Tax=Phenylobacterium hankyongense TaxID=1813876 RepID=A0A328B255_9CAUL|nr:MmcQ/YjbR family DNA-binding protein [Phenylobacterium hankyongense]RAK61480.1 MmcQ/YjbR family DNA-binding protein [Phenylobacterium hankyongense]
MSQHPEVPPAIVARLASVCLALPETRQEAAWVGVRWRVRAKTFAHVLMIAAGWPPAYARAAGCDGCVLTFRSRIAELDPRDYAEAPFFRPVWWPDIVGLVIDGDTDWDEVGHLLTASYCALAPHKLAQLVERATEPRS